MIFAICMTGAVLGFVLEQFGFVEPAMFFFLGFVTATIASLYAVSKYG